MTKDHILISLSESDKTSFGKHEFTSQSTPQKVFSSIWAVEAEVNNGGFSQYFDSSVCETVAFVSQALTIVGAPQTAEICNRAIDAAFPTGVPLNSDAIRAAAQEFSDETLKELDRLDREFYRYPHNLTDLLFSYVAKHPEEFGELPKPDDA